LIVKKHLSIGESAMPGANSYDIEYTFVGFEVYAYYDKKTEQQK
jgi:hypothetical protein